MSRRLGIFFIWLVLFGISAALVGYLLDFVPREYRRWFGYIVIPIVVFIFFRSWMRFHRKQVGNRNEMEWLYEVVDEQERGIRDNSNLLRQALPDIEREHQSTPELRILLERARRAINSP